MRLSLSPGSVLRVAITETGLSFDSAAYSSVLKEATIKFSWKDPHTFASKSKFAVFRFVLTYNRIVCSLGSVIDAVDHLASCLPPALFHVACDLADVFIVH